MRWYKMFVCLFLMIVAGSAEAKKERPSVVRLETTVGVIRVELSDETPRHRDNFLKLAREGRLDSTLFHRVIKDFMIQGGDPQSLVKTRDSIDYTLPAEFRLPWLYHVRGALAAAREPDDLRCVVPALSSILFMDVPGARTLWVRYAENFSRMA